MDAQGPWSYPRSGIGMLVLVSAQRRDGGTLLDSGWAMQVRILPLPLALEALTATHPARTREKAVRLRPRASDAAQA